MKFLCLALVFVLFISYATGAYRCWDCERDCENAIRRQCNDEQICFFMTADDDREYRGCWDGSRTCKEMERLLNVSYCATCAADFCNSPETKIFANFVLVVACFSVMFAK
ncbi:unnamed protein product [Tenebrio molitor]|nr:unnamed protein product [Tenebrio molitor]